MILPEWTIAELEEKLDSGELSTRQIAELYLQRIEAVDKGGPFINSVIELNPDALEIADALDAERKAGKLRGALHGVPVLLKDNIDTHDRMQTTAGSIALEGNFAAKDAFIVKQLRKSGALILGKTNLSELGELPWEALGKRVVITRRADAKPSRLGSFGLRFIFRVRSGYRGESRYGGNRNGN